MKEKNDMDLDYWRRLREKYFDASLSEDEEESLRRFVTSEGRDLPEFDSLRAVMGFFCAKKSEKAQPDRRKGGRSIAAMAVAAAAAAAFFVGVGTLSYLHSNECLAYFGKEKVKEEDRVMTEVRTSLSSVLSADLDLEEAMDGFFEEEDSED